MAVCYSNNRKQIQVSLASLFSLTSQHNCSSDCFSPSSDPGILNLFESVIQSYEQIPSLLQKAEDD